MYSQMENTKTQLVQQIERLKFFDVLYPGCTSDPGFHGLDNRETYEKNLQTCPENWHYRNKDIKYTLNSLGYRAPEFDQIDWKESVVIFGCSMVFGIGIDDSETMSAQLENILGRPVINMGVGGSSITFALHNSIILKNICPKPYAVIQIWSGIDRTVYYGKNLRHIGPWVLPQDSAGRFFHSWSEHGDNGLVHALMANMASRHLWSNTRYIEASMFGTTSAAINCKQLGLGIDRARDMQHPGPKTVRNVACILAKDLNSITDF